MLGAFILAVAGGIKAAGVFTRLRVARMDRLDAEKMSGPPAL